MNRLIAISIVKNEENKTITNTSSHEAPVIIIWGIFLFVPYPSSCNLIILGTTTAGDTAAITEPNKQDSKIDNFKIKCP